MSTKILLFLCIIFSCNFALGQSRDTSRYAKVNVGIEVGISGNDMRFKSKILNLSVGKLGWLIRPNFRYIPGNGRIGFAFGVEFSETGDNLHKIFSLNFPFEMDINFGIKRKLSYSVKFGIAPAAYWFLRHPSTELSSYRNYSNSRIGLGVNYNYSKKYDFKISFYRTTGNGNLFLNSFYKFGAINSSMELRFAVYRKLNYWRQNPKELKD